MNSKSSGRTTPAAAQAEILPALNYLYNLKKKMKPVSQLPYRIGHVLGGFLQTCGVKSNSLVATRAFRPSDHLRETLICTCIYLKVA